MHRLTLVTAFFDLAKRERNPKRRTRDFYLEHGEFLFGLNQDVLFFVDQELEESILARRRAHGLLGRTFVVVTSLEAMPDWALVNSIRAARSRNPVVNSNPDKDTPLYIFLTWSKLSMLQKAMAVDPFGSTHFAWIDLGIAAVARIQHCIQDGVFSGPSDKVKLLMLKSFNCDDLVDRRSYYAYIRGHLAAGYISANAKCMRQLCEIFKAEALASLEQGHGPSDEQLLPILMDQQPDLFEVYYGDYNGILENYSRVRMSEQNLLFQMRFCRDRQDFRRSCEIGARILRSHREWTFEPDLEYLSALLDEYFIASYYLEYPRQDTALEVARYYVELTNSIPAFRNIFLRNEDHIRSNFSFLEKQVLP